MNARYVVIQKNETRSPILSEGLARQLPLPEGAQLFRLITEEELLELLTKAFDAGQEQADTGIGEMPRWSNVKEWMAAQL